MKPLFVLFIFIASFSHSPRSLAQGMMERIEAAKIGIITQKLSLTAEQSKTFWVTYNQFSQEKKKISKELRQLFNESGVATDQQLAKNMERMMELKDQESAIDRKYFKEFQKSISIRQIYELYKAEIQFKAMLVDKLMKKGEKRAGKGRMNDDIEDELGD